MKLLDVKNLAKTYRGQKNPAVNDVSFSIDEGEIVGFLGLNGAGKSTTFKCVVGILPFDKGEIHVNGFDVVADELKAKASMSFIPDNHAVFEELTGNEYIDFMASMYHVTSTLREERKNELAQILSMTEHLDYQIKNYSHGMKQKIALMGGVIHYPALWIMDEPFVGLDPISLDAIINFMRKYVKEKRSIIFSSHILDMVQSICERIYLIDKGKIVYSSVVKGTDDLNKIFLDLVKGDK